MTTDRKIIIALIAIMLAGAAVLGIFAIRQQRALAAGAAVSVQDDKAIQTLQKQREDRDIADAAQRAAATDAESTVKTNADAVKVITRYLPAPPSTAQASAIVVPPIDLPSADRAKLPDSPSYVVETQAASVAIAKDLIACDADRKSLLTCQADLKDADAGMKVETHTATTWESAAKGGAKSSHILKALECIATAAGGAAAGAATKQPKWAALGAGAGAAVCQLF